VPFLQYWLRMRALGQGGEIFEYSMANVMAAAKRFALPEPDPRRCYRRSAMPINSMRRASARICADSRKGGA
jgi:hypothetical protein